MKLRTFLTVPASLFLVAVLLTPSAATMATDPNDTAGKLDVKIVEATRTGSSAPLHIKVVTYTGWLTGLLKSTGPNRILVFFNSDSDAAIDYTGVISYKDGHLKMVISGSGATFEALTVRHPNKYTITTVVPGGSPPNPSGPVEIFVRTRFRTSAGACAGTCLDRAPDSGWLAA